jgi:tRNA1Val (adenine37-N6)-methyltransferase
VELNNLQDKIRIINGDLTKIDDFAGKYGLVKHGFEVVTCNPPYSVVESGKQNPKEPKAIARHELLCTLEDVVAAADFLLKPHGKFFMIHRPYRLAEIFGALYAHQLEPKRMRMVCPYEDEEPNLVLIEARKNAQPRLKIEPQLAVYERGDEKSYTKQVQEIYEREKCRASE